MRAHDTRPRLTEAQIRAAHRLHVGGLSVAEIGRRVWRANAYASARSAASALSQLFAHRGLWTRPVVEANRLVRTTHGRTRRGDEHYESRIAYNRDLHRLRRGLDARCHGLIVRTDASKGLRAGERCARWARPGERFCPSHENRKEAA